METFVDNISTEQLAELEDVKLTTHVDKVRNLMKRYNTDINDDPIMVINNDRGIRIMMSEIILEIKQLQNDLRIVTDNIYIISTHSSQLSTGVKPHIYKDCINASDIFKKMSSEFEDLHMKSEQINLISENIEKQLTRLRRLYESVIKNTYDYV
jgi:hypothetical protein